MLKYKVNSKNLSIKYNPLVVSSALQQDGEFLRVFAEPKSFSGISNVLSFYREDGSAILYNEERYINSATTGASASSFACAPFSDIHLKAVSVEKCGSWLVLTFDSPHYLNENRDNIIPAVVADDINEIATAKLCDNDYVVAGKYFLYQWKEQQFVQINTVGNLYWQDSNGTHVTSCLVPVTYGGQDMKKTLLVSFDTEMANNFKNYDFFVKDERFFAFVLAQANNLWALTPKNGTLVRLKQGDPEFDMPISLDFAPSLLAEDAISQYLATAANEKIVAPLDYEKQQFMPVYHEIEFVPPGWFRWKAGSFDADYLRFNLHLRTRDADWNIDNETSDYWADPYCFSGDCVDRAGFTDEDIYYQRKKVSESFLRLSFYDKRDRGSQKLLYTVKLYLDSNRLWTDYVKCVDNPEISKNFDEETGIGPVEVISNNSRYDLLRLSFICSNRYDYDNPTEGFYLHLFPGELKEIEEPATIYMKAEFNNAAYGKIAALTRPIYLLQEETGTYRQLQLENQGKWSYTYTKVEDGKVVTDMKQLNEDMYIPIKIQYNQDKKRFEWWIENEDGYIIDLYEPLIVNYAAETE